MRTINSEKITDSITRLFIDANYNLPKDLKDSINAAFQNETDSLPKSIMSKLVENCAAAKEINVPICQDTGMAVVFAQIGQDVHIEGEDFNTAVNRGVANAYNEGFLRKSICSDPLFDRKNTLDNTPAVIFTQIVPGDKIKITAVPKGFGSENMSRIKMFTPSATKDDIVEFVLDTVICAGSNPCPPIVVGVGIGGDFEYCAMLSKLALVRDISIRNKNPKYCELEDEILEKINATGIGPQGFGGKTTALGVNIEYFPTHIAGLPCAVNIGCHVTRHKTCEI